MTALVFPVILCLVSLPYASTVFASAVLSGLVLGFSWSFSDLSRGFFWVFSCHAGLFRELLHLYLALFFRRDDTHQDIHQVSHQDSTPSAVILRLKPHFQYRFLRKSTLCCGQFQPGTRIFIWKDVGIPVEPLHKFLQILAQTFLDFHIRLHLRSR